MRGPKLGPVDPVAALVAVAAGLVAYYFRDEIEAAAEGAQSVATSTDWTGDGKWRNPNPAYRAGHIGMRNNNPGNIKEVGENWQGMVPRALRNEDGRTFVQFSTMPWGIRAAYRVLRTYRDRHGLNTVRKIVNRWAPPGPEQSQTVVTNYMNAVARAAGVGPDDVLPDTPAKNRAVLTAKFAFENGGQMPSASDLAEGFELAGIG